MVCFWRGMTLQSNNHVLSTDMKNMEKALGSMTVAEIRLHAKLLIVETHQTSCSWEANGFVWHSVEF